MIHNILSFGAAVFLFCLVGESHCSYHSAVRNAIDCRAHALFTWYFGAGHPFSVPSLFIKKLCYFIKSYKAKLLRKLFGICAIASLTDHDCIDNARTSIIASHPA